MQAGPLGIPWKISNTDPTANFFTPILTLPQIAHFTHLVETTFVANCRLSQLYHELKTLRIELQNQDLTTQQKDSLNARNDAVIEEIRTLNNIVRECNREFHDAQFNSVIVQARGVGLKWLVTPIDVHGLVDALAKLPGLLTTPSEAGLQRTNIEFEIAMLGTSWIMRAPTLGGAVAAGRLGAPGFDSAGIMLRGGARLAEKQARGSVVCGPTCVNMVLNTLKATAARTVTQWLPLNLTKEGCEMMTIMSLLSKNLGGVVKWVRMDKISLNQLKEVTSKGIPAIVQVKAGPLFHAIVVDGVTIKMGQVVVAIRDPGTGKASFQLASEFMKVFEGWTIWLVK